MYALFVLVDALCDGNLGFVRNALNSLYYRLTMPAGMSRVIPYVADSSPPATPGVTNPLLQPTTKVRNTAIRVGLNEPTIQRPNGVMQ